MPRAFDRRQLGIDRDPLRSLLPEVSKLPSLDIPDIFAVCNQPFITGMKLLGTGEGEVAKIATGLQTVIDTLFGTLFCNAQTGLSPQTMFGALGDLLEPIINSPFVQGLVELADWLGRATGTFLGDVFQGLIGLVDWVCGILTCNPNASGTTPQTLIDGFQAVLDPIVSNPFVQGIIAWADEVGVAVGNFALDLYNGILAMVEALCSLVTTGTLPTTYGNWSNTPLQIITDLTNLVETLLDNPIVATLRELVTDTGNLLYDTVSGLLTFFTSLIEPFTVLMGTGGASAREFLDAVLTWFRNVPIVGTLVSILTGKSLADGVALDLTYLGTWARGIIHNDVAFPAGWITRLIASIRASIVAVVPVANISDTTENLLDQGSFDASSTVAAADGWTWSTDTNPTNSVPGSGSAQVTLAGSGTTKFLYSTQTIPVAGGDRIETSAWVKTSANFTGGTIRVALVPFVGTVAQTPLNTATRTTSATTWTQMTGAQWEVPTTNNPATQVTSVRVRLSAAGTSGATVNFDTVSLVKSGLLGQPLVDKLLDTWSGAWNAVFGAGGAGKIWSDFVAALGAVNVTAGEGKTGAATANGNITGVIDGVGQAVFGDAAYAALPQNVKQSVRKLVGTLFGVNNAVLDEITAQVVPDLDGSIINSGTVPVDHLPTDQLLPTAGSGAILTRTLPVPVGAVTGRQQVTTGFYNNLEAAPSADIQVVMSGSQYTGAFKALTKGWYTITIGFGGRQIASSGWSLAPLLFKGQTMAGLAPYKVGAEVWATNGAWTRYAHGSFTVFLNAGDHVRAGYDVVYGPFTNPNDAVIDADTTGVENYFTIALISKIAT